ncbi:unnamed protein product [Adineta steineri]|uniref:Beta-lactamase-related domain-containing protein n=1 Tax=Adineta steineri TaxID=433720 RepID=A0A815ML01_9BILA|nr:unnamed protein product [Adineta steineri]CAF1422043.1 unnamed protein product [Adineta steineri]
MSYYQTIHFIIFILASLVVSSSEIIDYNIRGTIEPGWEFIYDLFQSNFVENRDLGASVAVYHQGKLVVDLSGGWFDESRTKVYDNNTLQLVFSTTKGLVAVAAAIAVQRNLLDYSSLVTRYWPEYGQYGKENTRVSDILSHRAGLPNIAASFDDYLNWTTMIHKLEEESPSWLPGSAYSYHSLTYGWLAGELIRRVDPRKRSLGKFIQDEISSPLNLEFYIGLPSTEEYRVSPHEFSQLSQHFNDESLNAMMNFFNDISSHEAEIPAGNGISNAYSIARLYSLLIGDVDHGKYKRILNEQIMKLATKSNTPDGELDLFSQTHTPFGMGFMLFDKTFPRLGRGSFGHLGTGGSVGLAAPFYNLSFAYVMNRMEGTISDANNRFEPMLTKIIDKLNK